MMKMAMIRTTTTTTTNVQLCSPSRERRNGRSRKESPLPPLAAKREKTLTSSAARIRS